MQNPSKPEPLTEDQIAEMREIFTLFDKDCDGFVIVEELGIMLRALNMNPSEQEVVELAKEIDPTGLCKFDQNSFISTAAKRGKDTETLDDIMEALSTLASERGADKSTSISKEGFKLYVCKRCDVIPLEDSTNWIQSEKNIQTLKNLGKFFIRSNIIQQLNFTLIE